MISTPITLTALAALTDVAVPVAVTPDRLIRLFLALLALTWLTLTGLTLTGLVFLIVHGLPPP